MPIRIQRKRTKGWKMPENAVSVTRPGRWGNPYSVSMYGRDRSIANFRRRMIGIKAIAPERFAELRGKDLACWCALDQPCHADVLLEIANSISRAAVEGENSFR